MTVKDLGITAVVLSCILAASPFCTAQSTCDSSGAERLSAVEEIVERQADIIARQQLQLNELASAGAAAAKPADEALKSELPSWLEGLRFSADLRLRYEGQFFSDDTRDRNRGRFRLRFGFEKPLTKTVTAGFRVVTGGDSDPTSANQTMTGQFDKKPAWFDLVYVTWAPQALPGLSVGAGKFRNPFVHTDMIWSGDLNPEGAWQTWHIPVEGPFQPMFTLGQMIVRERSGDPDPYLLAGQGGFIWKVAENVRWTKAFTYYDYVRITEPGNFFAARGNTIADGELTAGDFNIFNLTNIVDLSLFDKPLRLHIDYALNLGEDAPAPDDGLDTAWALGFTFGRAREKGTWQLDYKYARIEANAIVGGFSDAGFGYANRKGHVIGGTYALHRNISARLGTYFTEPERGTGPDRTTVQADLVFRF